MCVCVCVCVVVERRTQTAKNECVRVCVYVCVCVVVERHTQTQQRMRVCVCGCVVVERHTQTQQRMSVCVCVCVRVCVCVCVQRWGRKTRETLGGDLGSVSPQPFRSSPSSFTLTHPGTLTQREEDGLSPTWFSSGSSAAHHPPTSPAKKLCGPRLRRVSEPQ